MKLETTSIRPDMGILVRYFLLIAFTLFVLKAAVQVVLLPDSAGWNTLAWWAGLGLLSLGTSLGVSYGSRRFQLYVGETHDIEKTRGWALDYFLKNGLRILKESKGVTTLESAKSFNRLFNHWFGSERVTLRQSDAGLTIEGPFRHVDSLDAKLRFGKPAL